MDDDLKLLISIVITVIFIFSILCAGVTGISFFLERTACNHYSAMNADYQFKWDYWAGGCYVFVPSNGMWIHATKINALTIMK